jgi:lysophospholipase L1-like esterase
MIRRRFLPLAFLAAGSLAFFVAGCTTIDPALRDPEKNSALKPAPRDPNWVKRHEGFVAEAKRGGVDVLFLGDSITDGWRRLERGGGKKVWDAHFAPLHAANFGISGDRTQHVLWRMANGELEGINPKAVVLMIGTNNAGFERDGTTPRNTPAETAEGVATIVRTLRAKFPATKILLLAVFPRAEKPTDPLRLQVASINTIIARLDDGRNVRYLDIGPKFLAADGTLPKDIMPDFLHPNEKGYEIWAAAIKEPLGALLK